MKLFITGPQMEKLRNLPLSARAELIYRAAELFPKTPNLKFFLSTLKTIHDNSTEEDLKKVVRATYKLESCPLEGIENKHREIFSVLN